MDRDLKHYDKYIARLKAFARTINIKIQFKPDDGDGTYYPSRRTIRIDPDLSESREIACLLHELGHVFDDSITSLRPTSPLNKAYRAIYKEEHTPTQLALVRLCEKRAWFYGKTIAKHLNIRLGKWYAGVQRENLRSYK